MRRLHWTLGAVLLVFAVGCIGFEDLGEEHCEGEGLPGCPGGGQSDGGTDAGTDGGTDGGTDAGTDAGTDGGTDAGTDGGADAGTDAGLTIVALYENLAHPWAISVAGEHLWWTRRTQDTDLAYPTFRGTTDGALPVERFKNPPSTFGPANDVTARDDEAWTSGGDYIGHIASDGTVTRVHSINNAIERVERFNDELVYTDSNFQQIVVFDGGTQAQYCRSFTTAFVGLTIEDDTAWAAGFHKGPTGSSGGVEWCSLISPDFGPFQVGKSPSGYEVALAGPDVYWTDNGVDGGLFVVQRDGGSQAQLTRGASAWGMAADEEWIYWLESSPESGALYRRSIADGTIEVVKDGLNRPRHLVSTPCCLYFTEYGADELPSGRIWKVTR